MEKTKSGYSNLFDSEHFCTRVAMLGNASQRIGDLTPKLCDRTLTYLFINPPKNLAECPLFPPILPSASGGLPAAEPTMEIVGVVSSLNLDRGLGSLPQGYEFFFFTKEEGKPSSIKP